MNKPEPKIVDERKISDKRVKPGKGFPRIGRRSSVLFAINPQMVSASTWLSAAIRTDNVCDYALITRQIKERKKRT